MSQLPVKIQVVVFNPLGARILKFESADAVKEYLGRPDCIVGPVFKDVMGVPPHYWVKEGENIRAMNAEERITRDLLLGGYVEMDEPEVPLPVGLMVCVLILLLGTLWLVW